MWTAPTDVKGASPLRRRDERGRSRAFSLVELLVVVSITALLVAVLVPALRHARRNTQTIVCRANLKNLMSGIQAYAGFNADIVVPSYNMRGVTGSTSNPFDGWGPILDRQGYVAGHQGLGSNPFVCPKTLDLPGVPFDRAGADPEHSRGYMDWPVVITISSTFSRTLPRRGFDKLVRVAYWINGDNPTGLPRAFQQGIHFTGSVGYGPDLAGRIMAHNRFADFRRPAQLIALADGFYAGNQEATRARDVNRRIGYRHQARGPAANAAFADGHAGAIEGDRFPRRPGEEVSLEEARRDNLGGGATLYADPVRYLSN